MIKKISLASIVMLLFSFVSFSPFQELVLEKLALYAKQFPEKIYLQTDKPYYTIGDDIWYSAYLLNGITHKKSEKSKVVHVELINENDSIVSKKELFINDVSAAGDFKIEKEWKPGNYLLRAYTNYMRNSNADYFFKKQIPIWNTDNQNTLKNIETLSEKENTKNSLTETDTSRPDLNFYPEGGYLVEGIQSKVAIKIKDKAYHNENISGIVKDSENNTISAFKIFEFGLGSLTFTPEPNKKYYATLKINGKTEKYELPKALPEGFGISALNNGSEITIKATSKKGVGLKNAFLLVHQRGEVIFEKLIETASEKFTVKLNTAKLNSGVTHITLFNNSGKPVCERLVFIDNPKNDADVVINKNTENPKTKEKVTLKLALKDLGGNPLSGNLSLAISDLQAIQKNYKDDNIKTYLLLNSELRGEIENPGYFFKKENENKRKFLLDLVMLTHGWSRFTWEEMLYAPPKKENKFNVEEGIYITGKTQNANDKTKNISATTRLTFIKKGEVPFQEAQQSNEKGQFKFGPYAFYDSIPTLIEARLNDFKNDNPKNKEVHISIANQSYRSPKIGREYLVRKSTANKTVISSFLEKSLNKSKIDSTYAIEGERLQEIVIRAKKETEQQKRKEQLDSLSSYGTPSRRIDLNDIPGSESFTIATLLRRLPGITIINDSIYGRGRRAPQILLDETPVDYSEISFMNGNEIEFIDFLSGASASIIRNSSAGVISVYTKTGNGYIPNTDPVPGITSFDYPGFYAAREFYAPDYSDSFTDTTKKDIRTTLHWEPTIKISNNASTEINFYTCDARTDYTIEIEGITDSGIPIYKTSTFTVE